MKIWFFRPMVSRADREQGYINMPERWKWLVSLVGIGNVALEMILGFTGSNIDIQLCDASNASLCVDNSLVASREL